VKQDDEREDACRSRKGSGWGGDEQKGDVYAWGGAVRQWEDRRTLPLLWHAQNTTRTSSKTQDLNLDKGRLVGPPPPPASLERGLRPSKADGQGGAHGRESAWAGSGMGN
jgi:hypothetical protein